MPTARRPLAALVLVAAALAAGASAAPGRAPADRAGAVTILHFNDVYEIDAIEGGATGGIARLATVLARLRRAQPPVVATLGGDFLSPSAIGSARVDGEPLAGRQMVDVLNLAGLDWATLGNHEFDLPEPAFRARLSEARFGIVASNVTGADGRPFSGTVERAVVPVQAGGRTVRLGLIGLTIDSSRRPWVRYAPPIESARRQVAALAGSVDAIVALTHLTLAEDQDLVRAVPEIDVVLGGHEHENYLIRRGPGFTPIVKADANVRTVAVVTVVFGAAGARPAVTAVFEPLDARVPRDARVQAAVDRWMARGLEALVASGLRPHEIVTTTPEPLDGREATVRNRRGLLTDLIAAAMAREAAPVDAALLHGGSVRIDDEIAAGPVREYDVARILPFGDRVLRATLDGTVLAAVLDAGVQNRGAGGFLHHWGVERDDRGWLVQGRPLDPAARYAVALQEFLLTGGEARMGFLTRENPGVRDVREFRDIRQAVMAELRARYAR